MLDQQKSECLHPTWQNKLANTKNLWQRAVYTSLVEDDPFVQREQTRKLPKIMVTTNRADWIE